MKFLRNFILIVFFSSLMHPAKAQVKKTPYLNFTALPDMPFVQEWPCTVTDGEYIYSVNGYTPKDLTTNSGILKFDPRAKSWSLVGTKSDYKLQSSAVYYPVNGQAYVFGGLEPGNNTIYPGVEKLDLKTGTIVNLNIANPAAAISGASVVWRDTIYIFGGTVRGNLTVSILFSFDPKTGIFKRLTDMPENLQAAGVVVNNKLYTVGGYDSYLKLSSKNINAYDFKTDYWHTVFRLPMALSANNLATYGDLIFIVGDYENESFLGYYNTRTNRFTQLTSNMHKHRAAGVAIINKTLYVFGGKSLHATAAGGIQSAECADISDIIAKETAQ